MLCLYAEIHYAKSHVLFIIMLNVIKLSVIMLSVMAPFKYVKDLGFFINYLGLSCGV